MLKSPLMSAQDHANARWWRAAALCGALILCANAAHAGVASSLARESAEAAARKLGREVADEGVEALAPRVARLAAAHGDDVYDVARKVGPAGLRAIEEAGSHGRLVVRALARHGDRALPIVRSPRNLALIAKHGDDAATALVKHPGIATQLIETEGKAAARALGAVNPQNARRLAMMGQDGALAAQGRAGALLEVVARYGDRAASFIWRHRLLFVTGAFVAAFVSDPEPFLNGAVELSDSVLQGTVRPVVESCAGNLNWTLLALVGGAYLAWRQWRRDRGRGRLRACPATEGLGGTPSKTTIGHLTVRSAQSARLHNG